VNALSCFPFDAIIVLYRTVQLWPRRKEIVKIFFDFLMRAGRMKREIMVITQNVRQESSRIVGEDERRRGKGGKGEKSRRDQSQQGSD
jgi:hypothetical protein